VILRRLLSLSALFGLDLRKFAQSVRGLRPYFQNRALLNKQIATAGASSGDFPITRAHPCLTDRRAQSGVTRGARAYFHQDLHVAQMIHANAPTLHVDVGSLVGGFVAHVAAFRPIEVLDIRPSDIVAKNITFGQRDLMEERPDMDGYTDSLSCLHVLEHFGLGRYGDEVDYDGYRKGWENLYRMLRPGGKLYFSVPIGPQRIEFDAHRIFSVPFLVGMIDRKYRIDSFAYVDDEGVLVRDADATGTAAQNSFGCQHGCGIFELTKK
jgi:SAM-dependent methyltransferase